jgi:chaperonin GroES
MKYKLVPQYDRIAIVRDPKLTKYGLLEIPVPAQKDKFVGRVIAVGQGKLLSDGSFHKTHYKRGDWVLFGRYAGTDIEPMFLRLPDGREVFFIKEEDLYATIEEVREGEQDVAIVEIAQDVVVMDPKKELVDGRRARASKRV